MWILIPTDTDGEISRVTKSRATVPANLCYTAIAQDCLTGFCFDVLSFRCCNTRWEELLNGEVERLRALYGLQSSFDPLRDAGFTTP